MDARQSPSTEQVPWRAREGILLYGFSLLVLAVLTIGIVSITRDEDVQNFVSALIQDIVLFVAVLWWVRRRYDRSPSALGLQQPTRENVFLGVGIGLIGILLASAVLRIIEAVYTAASDGTLQQPEQVDLTRKPDLPLIVLIALVALVAAPIVEETFWRGFVLRGLQRSMGSSGAIIVSSVIFGVIHILAAKSWHLAGQYVFTLAIPLSILGALFAITAVRRQSIVPTIVAHMVFNTFGFVVLASRGFNVGG